jgi:hypothetical protein
MLTERLNHHRGRGQQQIVVKHVTVNADQAVVTDTIVTRKKHEAMTAAKLVTASADKPMETVEPMQKERTILRSNAPRPPLTVRNDFGVLRSVSHLTSQQKLEQAAEYDFTARAEIARDVASHYPGATIWSSVRPVFRPFAIFSPHSIFTAARASQICVSMRMFSAIPITIRGRHQPNARMPATYAN